MAGAREVEGVEGEGKPKFQLKRQERIKNQMNLSKRRKKAAENQQ